MNLHKWKKAAAIILTVVLALPAVSYANAEETPVQEETAMPMENSEPVSETEPETQPQSIVLETEQMAELETQAESNEPETEQPVETETQPASSEPETEQPVETETQPESNGAETEQPVETEMKPVSSEFEIEDFLDGSETETSQTEETENFTDNPVSESVKAAQALIEELPGVEELKAMSVDEQQEVYEKLQTAYDAYSALTDEEKAQITGAEIFDSLFAMFNSMVNTLATVNGVSYLDASGNKKTQNNVTVVDKNTTTWNAGWYVVNKGVAIDTRITVSGTVNLILADGYTLDAKSGIDVPENSHLLIYAQSTGSSMGVLNATGSGTGSNTKAGIGGDPCGSITINGGKINAKGNPEIENEFGAAGIGGGHQGSDVKGTITINGGEVTAIGMGCGFGIGAGYFANTGGTINITGGSVSAQSGKTSNYCSSGIGGNMETNIKLSGGIVKSTTSDPTGYGVCGNFSADGNGIIFTNSFSSTDNLDSWEGVIFQGTSGKVYAPNSSKTIIITDSFEIPSGYTLTIPAGTTWTIPDGVTITNNGTIIVEDGGAINGAENITGSGTIKGVKAPTPTVEIDNAKTTASSITVRPLKNADTYGGAEYSLDNVKWFTSNVFTGLHSNTTYTVYARYRGNGDYKPSDAGKVNSVQTNAASYTITIPADPDNPLEAGNENSTSVISVKQDKPFDLGYNGQVNVTIAKNDNVTEKAQLILKRTTGTEEKITSALLVNGTALGSINANVATFTMNNKESVPISFDSPTSGSGTIPAGTYNGTVTFEITYSEQ